MKKNRSKSSLWLNVVFGVLVAGLAVGAAVVWFNAPRGDLAPYPGDGNDLDPHLPWEQKITQIRANLDWSGRTSGGRLTRETLEQSLELGTRFLLANQKPEGNFNYQYDFVKKTFDQDDNQVRQAGALWGLALLYRDRPSDELVAGLRKGIAFFAGVTRKTDDGRAYIAYPGSVNCDTGTVALVLLSITDALRGAKPLPDDLRESMLALRPGYVAFIRGQQLKSGRFAKSFNTLTKTRSRTTSPYFDGESLLALAKTAHDTNDADLVNVVQKAARACAEYYTTTQWDKHRDSDKTKGFYQWGTMAFREYVRNGWPNAQWYEDAALALAWWQIHAHKTLQRTRNSAYAYEGLVSASALAKAAGDTRAAGDIGYVIDAGLYKMTSWQVEGPLLKKNSFLRDHRTEDPLAIGGIMNSKNDPPLRIDVTQHQMHAVLLALREFF